MRSGLYVGRLAHHRHAMAATGGVAHSFGYDVAYPLLFLDEIPEVFGLHPLWSARRPNAMWMRRGDFLGDPSVSLDDAVRDAAEERLGHRPGGPIAVLAHLRAWGWSFNPLCTYYCFDEPGDQVAALVLDVTSTPWLERHVYAIDATAATSTFPKAMHVSPFMGMDHDYELRWSLPGDRLELGLRNLVHGQVAFDASLTLRRHELSRRTLGELLWRDPQPSYRATAAIYRQALALVRKGAPFHARRATAARDGSPLTRAGSGRG